MKLYPRRLKSIEDLEQEKRMLKAMQKEQKEHPPLSVEGFTGGTGTGDIVSTVLEMVGGASPVIGIVSKILPLFRGKKKKQQQSAKSETEPSEGIGSKAKKVAGNVAKDVAFSYLKWKAVELSLKGIKKFINSRREKRAAEKH